MCSLGALLLIIYQVIYIFFQIFEFQNQFLTSKWSFKIYLVPWIIFKWEHLPSFLDPKIKPSENLFRVFLESRLSYSFSSKLEKLESCNI